MRDHALDELYAILAVRECRLVVRYFQDERDRTASIDDVVGYVASRVDADRRRVTMRLHHSILPKMADAELVAVDERRDRIHYHGHPLLARQLSLLADLSRE